MQLRLVQSRLFLQWLEEGQQDYRRPLVFAQVGFRQPAQQEMARLSIWGEGDDVSVQRRCSAEASAGALVTATVDKVRREWERDARRGLSLPVPSPSPSSEVSSSDL